MRALDEQARRYEQAQRTRRRRRALVGSLVLHAILLVAAQRWYPEIPEKPDKVLEIQLVSRGDAPGEATAATEPTPEPAPVPSKPTAPPPAPPKVAPKAAPTPPPAPRGEAPAVADADFEAPVAEPVPYPPTPPSPPTPRSFADWQRQQLGSFMPTRKQAGGLPTAEDRITNRGRDKCAPFPGRTPQRLILLFDSSGSMTPALNAQAMGCAQEYARTAIAGGATVIVGNFAGTHSFTQPTRDMVVVAAALTEFNDPTRTMLPARELNPFFDADPSAPSELVILSDGYIPNYRDAMPWLQYFLEMNPENRGYLYTLGSPGHPEVTRALKSIGFDVYIYRVM